MSKKINSENQSSVTARIRVIEEGLTEENCLDRSGLGTLRLDADEAYCHELEVCSVGFQLYTMAHNRTSMMQVEEKVR